MQRMRLWMTATIAMTIAAASGCAGSADRSPTQGSPPASPAAASAVVTVTSARDFDPGTFAQASVIDNPYFPMLPGTKWTWEGHATEDGERIRRRVEFTVTDMIKVVDGVSTVVALDVDFNNDERAEQELAFFAQDDGGNVWHFGQYPEEYEGDTIVKTPAWIHGFEGALAGLTMKAHPSMQAPSYAQGWGPEVGWNDRAVVFAMDEHTCTPVDCYDSVLIMREFGRDEPGASQLKYYAPGVGGVRIGWMGPNEEEREVMVLVSMETLSPEELDAVRETVLQQEQRAYELSDVYGNTEPMVRAPA